VKKVKMAGVLMMYSLYCYKYCYLRRNSALEWGVVKRLESPGAGRRSSGRLLYGERDVRQSVLLASQEIKWGAFSSQDGE